MNVELDIVTQHSIEVHYGLPRLPEIIWLCSVDNSWDRRMHVLFRFINRASDHLWMAVLLPNQIDFYHRCHSVSRHGRNLWSLSIPMDQIDLLDNSNCPARKMPTYGFFSIEMNEYKRPYIFCFSIGLVWIRISTTQSARSQYLLIILDVFVIIQNDYHRHRHKPQIYRDFCFIFFCLQLEFTIFNVKLVICLHNTIEGQVEVRDRRCNNAWMTDSNQIYIYINIMSIHWSQCETQSWAASEHRIYWLQSWQQEKPTGWMAFVGKVDNLVGDWLFGHIEFLPFVDEFIRCIPLRLVSFFRIIHATFAR